MLPTPPTIRAHPKTLQVDNNLVSSSRAAARALDAATIFNNIRKGDFDPETYLQSSFNPSEIVRAEIDEDRFVYGIDDNGVDDGTGATGVNYDISPPPVDLFYDTLEDALGFMKVHGYALTKLRSKKARMGREIYLLFIVSRWEGRLTSICIVIAANLVHLVYKSKTGGESKAQDASIVPSLGYWFIQKNIFWI